MREKTKKLATKIHGELKKGAGVVLTSACIPQLIKIIEDEDYVLEPHWISVEERLPEDKNTVLDITVKYLKAFGYDGLCGDECGCGLDDIAPCGYDVCVGCIPAYRHECEYCKVIECEYREDTDGCFKPSPPERSE